MPTKPPPLQNLVVLWSALLFSHFVFIGVLFVVPPQPNAPEPFLPYVLAMAALPAAIMSQLLPKLLFKKAVLARPVEMVEMPDPEGLPGFGKTIRAPKDGNALLRGLVQAYGSRVIVGSALAESVSLMGFVVKFLGFGWPMAAPFFAVGIASALSQKPSSERFVSEVEGVLGVRLS